MHAIAFADERVQVWKSARVFKMFDTPVKWLVKFEARHSCSVVSQSFDDPLAEVKFVSHDLCLYLCFGFQLFSIKFLRYRLSMISW